MGKIMKRSLLLCMSLIGTMGCLSEKQNGNGDIFGTWAVSKIVNLESGAVLTDGSLLRIEEEKLVYLSGLATCDISKRSADKIVAYCDGGKTLAEYTIEMRSKYSLQLVSCFNGKHYSRLNYVRVAE